MKIGYVIGRFQPFHNGHLGMILQALRSSDRVFVIIGSTGCAPSYKNPWSPLSIGRMIEDSVSAEHQFLARNLSFVSVEDQPYDDAAWAASVCETIKSASNFGVTTVSETLFGHTKDHSSFYLKMFPEWQFVECKNTTGLDATVLREEFFLTHRWSALYQSVPTPVYETLMSMPVEHFDRIRGEAQAIKQDAISWKSEGGKKYGVQHVTADVMLDTPDSVLVVRRAGKIGYGTLAMSGGFVEQGERLIDAALRELQEETAIEIKRSHFPANGLFAMFPFDHPRRSMNGRIFTNVLAVSVPEELEATPQPGECLEVLWIPKDKLASYKGEFFADHYHIITKLLEEKKARK